MSDVASFVSDNHEGSDSDLCPCLMPVVNGFRIAHLNCHSFLLHKEEVFSLMRDYHLDVLALSETWLDDTVSDVEVLPPGCERSLLHQDRNRHGGGVAFLISNYLRYCWREFHVVMFRHYGWNCIHRASIHCYCAVLIDLLQRWTFMSISLLNVKKDSHTLRKF